MIHVHQLLLRNQQRHSKAWMLCWLKQWHIVVIIYTNTSLQANNLIQFTKLFQYSFVVFSLTSFGLSPDMICTGCVRRRGEKVNTGIYQNPVWKNQVSNRVLIILFLLCVPRQLYRWNPTKIGEVFNSKDHDISLRCPMSTIILSWQVIRNVYITTLHTATMIYYCLGKIWYMSPDWKKIVISVVKSTSDDIDTELANDQFNYRICLIHMVRVQQSHSAHQHKSAGRNWKKFLRNLEVCTGVDFF